MNAKQIVDHLRKIQGRRSLSDFAADLGIGKSYLHRVYSGIRPPGPKILAVMGLRRVKTVTVVYVPVPQNKERV